MTSWIPLLASLIALTGVIVVAVLNARFSKRNEHARRVYELRSNAYSDYIQAVMALRHGDLAARVRLDLGAANLVAESFFTPESDEARRLTEETKAHQRSAIHAWQRIMVFGGPKTIRAVIEWQKDNQAFLLNSERKGLRFAAVLEAMRADFALGGDSVPRDDLFQALFGKRPGEYPTIDHDLAAVQAAQERFLSERAGKTSSRPE